MSEVAKFIEYLTKGDIVLSYWNPQLNELMPITYTTADLVKNYESAKAPISGKVKVVR